MPDIEHLYFNGQHCETTTTGTLLNSIGIPLSEPLLFGVGQGLGYIFWKMKTMEFPFIGGRIKPDLLTLNISNNLGLKLNVFETSSSSKAWQNVKTLIDNGQVVGLKMDCYHLEYFSQPFHFAGHYAAIYNYDTAFAYLVDTHQQGGKVKTSLESLAKARSEKGPMASKNLYYTLKNTHKSIDLKAAISKAITNNVQDYLNPPISNISYKGIQKTSKEVLKWFDSSKNISEEFKASANMMEHAGTGGALFRNLYRDFLKEAAEILENEIVAKAHQSFIHIAQSWETIATLFVKASNSGDRKYIEDAAKLFLDIALQEKATMTQLSTK